MIRERKVAVDWTALTARKASDNAKASHRPRTREDRVVVRSAVSLVATFMYDLCAAYLDGRGRVGCRPAEAHYDIFSRLES